MFTAFAAFATVVSASLETGMLFSKRSAPPRGDFDNDWMPNEQRLNACRPLSGVQQIACDRVEQILPFYPDQCSISSWLLPHCSACGSCVDSNPQGFSEVGFDPAFDWSEPASRGVDVLQVFTDDTDDIDWDEDFMQKIVGGQAASPGQFPFFVDLLEEDGGRWYRTGCGASFIHEDAVLTAAHCLDDDIRFDVIVGAFDHSDSQTYRDNGGQRFSRVRVSRVEIHPDYDGHTKNDIAILHLASSGTDGGRIRPTRLGRTSVSAGTSATVIGMGDTSERGRGSSRLRHVTYPIISNSECQRLYHDFAITNDMLCAYRVGGGVDACQGDSGGPLVRGSASGGFTQHGVVSWGVGCARQGAPGVYARVSYFFHWIRDRVSRRTRFPSGFLFSY
jgi:trypsin